jgi:predicted type IV restriction endonuclease
VMIFFGLGVFQFILPLAFSVVFSILIRQNIGGYWSFRQAVQGVFIMFLISFAILTIGRDWIFGKLIEPNMLTKTEIAIENSERISYKQQGLSHDKIEIKIAEKKQQFAMQKKATFLDLVEGYITTILLLSVLAMLFSLVLRREIVQTARPL